MAEDPLNRTSVRVFLAIPLYEIFAQEIENILRSLQRGAPGVRWAVPRQVHLTLHFFGAIPAKEIELIRAFSKKVALLFAPLKLGLGRIGGFPDLERPNIVWLGVKEPSGRLLSLQRAIHGEALRLGFRTEDRPYQPHATIGRVKKKSRDLGLMLAKIPFEGTSQEKIADHFVLFQSHFLPEGVRYEVLETYPFSKKA